MRKLALILAVSVLAFSTSPAMAAKVKKVTADETFLQLPTISASVGGPYRFRGLMNVEYGLEILDPKLREYAKSIAPRLRDSQSQAFTQYAMAYYRVGEVPNADELALRLQRSADQALGRKGARVLLGSILVTR